MRPPTDKQLARLEAAERKAAARAAATTERRLNDIRAVSRRHYPKEAAADKAWRAARAVDAIASRR